MQRCVKHGVDFDMVRGEECIPCRLTRWVIPFNHYCYDYAFSGRRIWEIFPLYVPPEGTAVPQPAVRYYVPPVEHGSWHSSDSSWSRWDHSGAWPDSPAR